jgi:PAS domain S-box-containing protein
MPIRQPPASADTAASSRHGLALSSTQQVGHACRLGLYWALAYAALALLWLWASATWAGDAAPGEPALLRLAPSTGLLLVAMTAILIYAAVCWVTHRLARHEALLRQRELQLSDIVDTAMDAIITVDAAHKIVVFNRAAAQVFRVPAEQALGQPLDRFLPHRSQAAHRKHVRRFAERGTTARRMGMLHTLTGLRADGEEFPMEASVSRLGEGDEVLMTVVLRDATERLATEKARQAQLAAELASQAKTQLLANTSHELRTPLNAILGFSQLLLTPPTGALDDAQLRQVEHIRDAGWHLLALVNDVLDISRIESGALQVDIRSVELHPLLDEACLLIGEEAHLHGVRIDAAFRARAPAAACCDPQRLRQVLVNLLSNAVKYNRPGGQVRIDFNVDADKVRLELADTGLGMTQEQLAHLYEPFNRLGRERGGVEGTGIGLALTRQLVLRMNGELQIDSMLGRGTTARLVLPWTAPADAVQPSVPAALDMPEGPRLPTVLYIEDNAINMLVVEQLLARWPIARLAQAEDATSGLALARQLQPDLILLDMRLPDMSGLEVLEKLRSDPETAALRVVALSASAMAADVDQARRGGALAYWTKPLKFNQFLQDMQQLLVRSESL